MATISRTWRRNTAYVNSHHGKLGAVRRGTITLVTPAAAAASTACSPCTWKVVDHEGIELQTLTADYRVAEAALLAAHPWHDELDQLATAD